MTTPSADRIDTLLDEQRSFPPTQAFREQALVNDHTPYAAAQRDREEYWAGWAGQLEWIKPWSKVLEWRPPHAKWFIGGKLNVSANCLDRHVTAGRGDRVALLWEGEPGDTRRITYRELHADVCRFGNVLKRLGVQRGDRVAIYMPMVPEVAVAMLACARIGAVHTVVFGGFSAESLRDRINDAAAKVLVTADGGYRRGAVVPLKQNADEALGGTPSIEHVVVLRRTKENVPFAAGRDHWWHDEMARAGADCPPEAMDAEDPLFIL
jgi:acetyl-CoA synthetase